MNKPDSTESTLQLYKDVFNDDQVRDFLTDEGISVDQVLQFDTHQRTLELVKGLFSFSELNNLPIRPSLTSLQSDEGLVVVKPEALPLIDTFKEFLESVGLQPNVLPTKRLSKQEWLRMYGYMLPMRPEIVHMYIVQRSLGMTAIRFDHLAPDEYFDYVNNTNQPVDKSLKDINAIFDSVFCGSSTEFTPGTLRWEITNKHLAETSLATMTGDAEIFDPVNYYKDGNKEDIFRAFNGIHVPSNNSETYQNLTIFKQND